MATNRYIVREATIEDAPLLYGRMRHSDELEVQAAAGLTADKALWLSLATSTMAWIGLNEGRAVLAFGVGAQSMLSPIGSPWLLGTDEIEDVGIAVVKNSRQYVRKMVERYRYLENWTDDRHVAAHAWLRWCGFNLEEPVPYGKAGLPFRRFWL